MLFTLGQEFLSHLIRLDWKGWDQNVGKLGFQNATQRVEIRVLAANFPPEWLGRDSVQNVVRREEASFANL